MAARRRGGGRAYG